MYIKNKKGQSTVEYILLVTAVIAVIILFVTNKSGGLQAQMNTTLNTVTGDIGTAGDTLSTSHQAQPASQTPGGTPPSTASGFNVLPS